jgi:ABC-type Fe3+/spermidine/putrescine transport system ATPase subunit
VSFGFAPKAEVVSGFSLALEPGTFFSLLGPSGCGKTTLLRLVGGYHQPAAGAIVLDGRDVTGWPPERRDVGMVFQNYALFPHLTARANVAFGLEMRQVPRRQRQRRVEEMLERVGLAAGERGRYPRQLSGGQQQRVALARALVIEPRLLLLDEPLANLDRQLRLQMRDELRALQQRTGVTTLLVTHDQEEALALADAVGLMGAGRLLQAGTPHDLYHRPRTPFAARFLGEANLLEVERCEDGRLWLRGGWALTCRGAPAFQPGDRLMIRPESCLLGPAAAGCPYQAEGQVRAVTFLGPEQVVEVAVAATASLRVRCRPQDGSAQPGAAVQVGVQAEALWIIPEDDPDWAK